MNEATEQEMKRRIKELEDRVDALCERIAGLSPAVEQHGHVFDAFFSELNKQRRDESNTW